MNHVKKTIKKVSKKIWVLFAIIVIGIFMRTYNFHNWLDFGSDQVNDATRVGAVIESKAPWPSYGPDMGNSGKGGRQNRFLLGPMYYDFEIISAKIFGNNPVSMAYPDLLFGILSLPLFYYFLRRIFDINLSLALTGLYSISFYALTFSHSAWNVNSIPFFSLLFLLSLYEFIVAKEITHWGWIVTLGVALGVSFQLHAILLVLFPATLFFACILYMRKNPKIWKKLGVVIIIMIILNTGQIIGEQQRNFKNSKIFLYSVTGPSSKSSDNLAVRMSNDLSCNFQANAYMLASVGDGNCNFSLSEIAGGKISKQVFDTVSQPQFILETILCLIFSLLGCGLFIDAFRKEKSPEKRYFLGLIMLYMILSFFVMLPVLDSALRYFVHTFFLPFILLGFIVNFLIKKFPKNYLATVATIFTFVALLNISSLYLEIRDEFAQSRIILGQVESMVNYMISQSGSQKEIYLYSDPSASNFYQSLNYIATENNILLSRASDKNILSLDKARFYINVGDVSNATTQIDGKKFDSYKVFNQATIYHLTN